MDTANFNACAGPARRRLGALLIPLFMLLGACSSPSEQAHKHYALALALFEKGGKEDLVRADTEFRNALMIKRTLAPAIYGLALVAEKQGKFKEQFSYLTQTLEQDPNHFEAQVKIGKMLLAAGQLERAREASDKALALKPEDVAARVLRAGLLAKQGDKAGAVALADAVLARDAANAEALEFMAGERLAAGDAETAIQYAERGLKAGEDQVPLLAIKIQALEKLARLDAAEATIRKLIALHPENPAFRAALIRFLVSHARQDAAEAELRAAAVQAPHDVQAKLEVVRFLHATKGMPAARRELEAMTRKDPAEYALKFALVELHQAANDRAAAEALVRSIMAQAGDAPDGLQAKAVLAGYLMNDGDKPAAMALVDAILGKDKRNQQALLIKAAVAIDERRLDQAIGDLRDLLRDAPDSARALMLLGKAHELQGSPELAEEQYAHAFQAGGMEASFGAAYAEFLMRRGQSARAEKLLGEMLRARPGQIALLNLLVRARNDQGNWAGAKQALAEIRRLGG